MKSYSHGLAILFESIGRFRWVAAGVIAEFATLAVLARALPERWLLNQATAGLAVQFLLAFFIGLSVIFSGTVARPRTGMAGYPARMFLLPISNVGLAGWPMLFGMVAMATGWVLSATAILPRLGYDPPVGLGALTAAAVMACMQSLGWWPFASNLGMLVTSCVVLPALCLSIAIPVVILERGPMAAWVLLPLYIAGAFAVAVRGIALDRRGEGRDGGIWRSLRESVVDRFTRDARPFASAARAQSWFEWRTKGVVVLMIVVAVASMTSLIVVMLPLVLANADRSAHQAPAILVSIGFTSLILCWTLGGSFARDEMSVKSIELSPFIATRPLTCGDLAFIRIRSAGRSLLAAQAVVLLLLPACLVASGNVGPVASMFRSYERTVGMPTAVGAIGLGVCLILLLTWKGMIGGMVPVFAGSRRVNHWCIALGTGLVLATTVGILWTVHDPDRLEKVLIPLAIAGLPWGMGLALIVKATVGTVLFRWAMGRGLISGRTFATCAVMAATSVAAGFVFSAIVLRPATPTVWLDLALTSALVPPWGRLAAGPLALASNRHR